MDSKKLLKAIKVIVSEEVKRQLPLLVERAVEKQMKNLLKEVNLKQEVEEEIDMFSMANKVLEQSRQGNTPTQKPQTSEDTRSFSRNPVIDQILRETQVSANSEMINEVSSHIPNYIEAEPDIDTTINFSTNRVPAGMESMRHQMAEKMGYGDMGGARQGGLGVQTGNDALDKALNRDYSQLVKRFKK